MLYLIIWSPLHYKLTLQLFTDINVPTIVTHPIDMVTNASESVTLNCKGTGGGSLTYQWETSDVMKDQWKEISNSNGEILVIRNLEKSERYRCIVSTEVGSAVSNASTVTLMGKLFIVIGR